MVPRVSCDSDVIFALRVADRQHTIKPTRTAEALQSPSSTLPDGIALELELELPRFGGRFAGQDGLVRPSCLLSYSIGER